MVAAPVKWLDDLIVAPDRTSNEALNTGDGHSYGVDLALVKRITTSGFAQIAYSYSVSKRDDNFGEGLYDADFNRPHVFSVIAAYEINANLQVGAKWKYMSGRPTDDFIINADVETSGRGSAPPDKSTQPGSTILLRGNHPTAASRPRQE